MDTIREKIIQAVVAKLARVKTSAGYATGCGANVLRGVTRLAVAELPAFVVFPGAEQITRGGGVITALMELTVEGHVATAAGIDSSVLKEQIYGDTIRIMTDRKSIENTTGGLGEDVSHASGGGDGTVETDAASVGVSTVFTIKYKYRIGDPYSQ
ncbi:MAG: hypothetical protein P1P81_04430 [Desulfobulbales bacterium]|nr:hypothetical protein [Desulfobulbales bacterium]